jgi:hypothetical protein
MHVFLRPQNYVAVVYTGLFQSIICRPLIMHSCNNNYNVMMSKKSEVECMSTCMKQQSWVNNNTHQKAIYACILCNTLTILIPTAT